MPNDPASRREHPSTYFVQDRSNEAERTRVALQDQMITVSMGGVLPEQPDPTIFHHVLDVGCGSGGWLIEMARVYPTAKLLAGVDISSRMVEYARAQAEEQQVSSRVEFHTMDALRMLEFPVGFFDLVNQRLGTSYLRTWDWPKLLQEFQRVTRSGGVVRITEGDTLAENNSPALTRLADLWTSALAHAGHLFNSGREGVTSELAHLMQQYGLQDVQTRESALEYRAGTEHGRMFAEDMRLAFRTVLPFLQKWTRVPDDYEDIYQQALDEIQQPGFVATWHALTVWGIRPRRIKPSSLLPG